MHTKSRAGGRSADEAIQAKGQVRCRESYAHSSNCQAADLVPSFSTLPPIFRCHRHLPFLPRDFGRGSCTRPHISEKNGERSPEYTDRRDEGVSEDDFKCHPRIATDN